jgi:acetyl/propionyl-CoA carboxylase alpha subunit
MGVEPVAVYSDVDRKALHVRMAHSAVALGGSTPRARGGREDRLPDRAQGGAGSGGQGKRFVRAKGEMATAFRTASSEAQASFGDGRLHIERYLDRSRHIGLQMLFDNHKNGVHFGELECSTQRPHQKPIEEAPSMVVDDALRTDMGEIAVRVGAAAGYQKAARSSSSFSR